MIAWARAWARDVMGIKAWIASLLWLLFGATLGFGLVSCTCGAYGVERDIVSWWRLALATPDAESMSSFLAKLEENMETRGMIQGHAALFFQTPSNDMGRLSRIVAQYTNQAQRLATLNRESAEYSTGMLNLRNAVQQLRVHPLYFWLITDGRGNSSQ